jgi:hypothetical protein
MNELNAKIIILTMIWKYNKTHKHKMKYPNFNKWNK